MKHVTNIYDELGETKKAIYHYEKTIETGIKVMTGNVIGLMSNQ